jgi:hypothetical protein
VSETKLPQEYVAFEKVWVCGNIFDQGRVILEIQGNPVFLIGKAPNAPLVWLNVPKPIQGRRPEWQPAIVQSKPAIAGFEVYSSDYGYCILHGPSMLMEFRVVGEVLVISTIDLRPVGLNVFGNLKQLNVSGTTLASNSFVQVSTMIGIGDPES